MLTCAFAVFGPIVVCCVAFYLRWQLPDVDRGSGVVRVAVRLGWASNDCRYYPSQAQAPVGARVRAARVAGPRGPDLPRGPGVYVAGPCEAQAVGGVAMIRGQLLAERIVSGRFQAQRSLRRGRKGALDVIVVGANAVGVSASLHLMHAGLRVLLVDRDSPSSRERTSIDALFRSLPSKLRSARLPLLTGHSVSFVAERPDGMLEVQAERAAWYTANVIFASTESLAQPAESATSRAG